MKNSLILASALALATAPAFAGSNTPPPMEPPVTAPAPVQVNLSPDWTGFYGGLQLGYGTVDSNIPGGGDGFIGGLTAGYDYDVGNFVFGGGLDYDFADIDIGNGAADLENIFRAKLRSGYKIGQGLAYITGGYALAETDQFGSEDGLFAGVGYEHRISDNYSLGGEVLYHEFDNVNSTTADVEATTVQLRGTYRF